MHRFSVAAAAEELAAHAERQTADRDAPLDAAPELVQLSAVGHVEHADDGALFGGCRDPTAVRTERECSQRTVVRRYHSLGVLQFI